MHQVIRTQQGSQVKQGPVICVFCGARKGHDPRWVGLAREFGQALARQGYTLLYGGGHVGLMGELADAALAEGGAVIGVMPESLMRREVGHPGLAELEVVPDMHLRKQRMIARSDAFVTLPGGLGTLDELFEVMTLAQLGEHARPMLLVDPTGYFDALFRLLDDIVEQGLASPQDVQALQRVASVSEAMALLAGCVPRLPLR
jgi:uncharacterized protein (TIGR00730 family)